MNCVRQAQQQQAAPSGPPTREITAEKIFRCSQDVIKAGIQLPETVFVGPGTHADCRFYAGDPVSVAYGIIDNVGNSSVCVLKFHDQPLQLHPGCPEGDFFAPPVVDKETKKLIFKPILAKE